MWVYSLKFSIRSFLNIPDMEKAWINLPGCFLRRDQEDTCKEIGVLTRQMEMDVRVISGNSGFSVTAAARYTLGHN